MKKKKGYCSFVGGDMFSDGLIILTPNRRGEFYEALVRTCVKMSDKDMKDWRKNFEKNKNANGYVAMEDDAGKWQIIVFTDRNDWQATLSHEALHAAERMCDYREIPISKDTEELRAMLVGKIIKFAPKITPYGNKE